MSIYDEDFCWFCYVPGSICNCELSESPWSKSTSQDLHDDREKPAHFDLDELSFVTMDGNSFFGGPFHDPDVDTAGDMIYCLGSGSQRPYAASTPKNNMDDAEKWASPPPESSSPVGIGTDSSPFSTAPALLVSRPQDGVVDRLLFPEPRDGGQLRIKALYNEYDFATTPVNPSFPSSTPKYQIQRAPFDQTSMPVRLQARGHPADATEGTEDTAAQGSLEEPITVKAQDICAVTDRTDVERTIILGKPAEIGPLLARRSLVSASRTRTLISAPIILDLAISTELEPSLSNGAENNDRPTDATVTNSCPYGNGGVPPKFPTRKVSVVSISFPAQDTPDSRFKRRRSSVDCLPESKKVKLERVAAHVSCASDRSVESKYKATEPASIRRARSLRSEISACSEESTDSLFYPSPLSSPTCRPRPENEYPPTVPSTPLPDSVDYARSKANPLIRTLVVYRRKSLSIPALPLVPIIAPPPDVTPTIVHCAEDVAIDRLKNLLLRQRAERERDGLNIHDEKRSERLKATFPTNLASTRRDTGSTDSSECRSQWEEESTRSASEAPESQENRASAPNVRILTGQHRLVTRETWSNAFGIANDCRKEITQWILEKRPKEPVPCDESSGDRHYLGIDLHDQLTNSPHTRFHAAQLFHRYFVLPDKVEPRRELCELERREQLGKSVWDLAVACVALSVKLHRDVLPPLGPIFAAEFLQLTPYSMTHEAFELAQRDIMYTFQFQLGCCTPQDVLDELWNALPTLRKATAPIRDGWKVVQCVTWGELFKSLLEPDMLQYPVTLLTAAALIDSLIYALARHLKMEAEGKVCECNAPPKVPAPADSTSSKCVSDDTESPWEFYHFEASQLVDDVILDVKDVLQFSEMELDECRMWFNCIGQE